MQIAAIKAIYKQICLQLRRQNMSNIMKRCGNPDKGVPNKHLR